MLHIIKHFQTITKHRHRVIEHCFKAGIPLQGLRHDLSKYSLAEFIDGVPNAAIQTHGCITKAEISIILNTGQITIRAPSVSRLLKCH